MFDFGGQEGERRQVAPARGTRFVKVNDADTCTFSIFVGHKDQSPNLRERSIPCVPVRLGIQVYSI